MDSDRAVDALGALAQDHRLSVFRQLVQAGAEGMPAGAIAAAIGIPASSLSFHLAQLSRAGMVTQERKHRSIIYRADFGAMTALIGFLTENCCRGNGSCGSTLECIDLLEKEKA